MNASGRAGSGLTRRVLLAGSLAGGLSAKDPERPRFPSEWHAFLDPATEYPLTRLTNPVYASGLCPGPWSRDAGSLLYWGTRTGKPQVFRMDVKTGESEQLTDAGSLDPASVALLPGGRGFCFRDGAWLHLFELHRRRQRRAYSIPAEWSVRPGLSVSPDGRRLAFIEQRGDLFRLRVLGLPTGSAATWLEEKTPLSGPALRTRPEGLVYRRGGGELWIAGAGGRGSRRLSIAEGGLGAYLWSPDGAWVLYLSLPADRRALHSIRRIQVDRGADELVAPTSQFVAFSPNRDASVFVGASGSKASPYLLLLVRATGRELALCEHRASDAAAVAPVFSPGSQQVYFQSDRDGQSAIYRVPIDKLVEKTDT